MTIFKSLLGAAAFGVALASSALAYSGEVYAVCKLNPDGDNFLALRTCGSTKCPTTHRLGPGTFLLSWNPHSERGWRQVTVMRNTNESSATGPSGWVYEKYICEVLH